MISTNRRNSRMNFFNCHLKSAFSRSELLKNDCRL
uniref:Uncharacterized protein n=1 Tax=Ascaris lumbricoides TaxID=6252 RepID=A0A0M3IUT1_ASCLU